MYQRLWNDLNHHGKIYKSRTNVWNLRSLDSELPEPSKLEAGGKPSTWFPPGGLVEHLFFCSDELCIVLKKNAKTILASQISCWAASMHESGTLDRCRPACIHGRIWRPKFHADSAASMEESGGPRFLAGPAASMEESGAPDSSLALQHLWRNLAHQIPC